MAARRSEESRSNSSLEFVWVRLNGSDTTIEGALRTVQQMRAASAAPARQLPRKPETKRLPGKDDGQQDEDDPTLPFDDQDEEDLEGELVSAESSPASSSRSRGKPRLPKGLPDLDFNSATPTFRDYAGEKKPQDQFEWYLLVASWLKKYKNVEEISLRHIVTAKQYIGADWPALPEDAGQPFRDGRRPQHGIFEKGSKNGLSRITKIGEDRVERMGKKE